MIRLLIRQIGGPAYRWTFLFNLLGMSLTLLASWYGGMFLPMATVGFGGNLIIILIQCSISAYWVRVVPLHRRTDDPEV